MYEWHGKNYWGAAHGLAGIMHVLMHTELKLDEQDDVKNTLLYMIKNRFPSGNYPSSEGNETDLLVHWCHGAPGVALTLAKAYEVFAASVYACSIAFPPSRTCTRVVCHFIIEEKVTTPSPTPIKHLNACMNTTTRKKRHQPYPGNRA